MDPLCATLATTSEAVNEYLDIAQLRGAIGSIGSWLVKNRQSEYRTTEARRRRTMSSVGIGTSVGLGAMIGGLLGAPRVAAAEYIGTFVFYGFASGCLFELCRLAFTSTRSFHR